MGKIRDRFWLWGHDAGSHDEGWSIPGKSRITPVEAAFYLSIPNIIMVRYNEASSPASVQYSVPFRPLNEVVDEVQSIVLQYLTARTARRMGIPAPSTV